jgi:SMODS-associated and fused to various effectors sensor domain
MGDVCSCFRKDFPFRALVHVHDPCTKTGTRRQLLAAEAVQLAHLAVNGLRDAWKTYRARGTVHVFLAVPAGLAFLIGQFLNGFGDVRTL